MQNKTENKDISQLIYLEKKCARLNEIECVNSLDQADLVHINTFSLKAFFMALTAKKKGIPVVYQAHSTHEDLRNSYIGSNLFAGVFKKWIKLCYCMGDIIVTPSEYSKKLIKSYGIKKEIYAISNGIDFNDYIRDKKAGSEFRKKYGYSDSDKIIMSAGLLIKRKGILDFINLAKRMPEYKFIWFGSSNLQAVGKQIRNAVTEKLPNLIFAGYVSKTELKAAYSGCNMFLFLSSEETEGIVVLEALAMKIPILLNDIPVYTDWLKKDRDVYKASNLDEFKKLTREIISGELPDITDNGYNVAKKRSISITGKQLACVYSYCFKQKLTAQTTEK